jgi:hypothetical protein
MLRRAEPDGTVRAAQRGGRRGAQPVAQLFAGAAGEDGVGEPWCCSEPELSLGATSSG